MTSADITRRELTLGAADTITGWYAKTYAETTIHGIIEPKDAPSIMGNFGRHTGYSHTFYTKDIVYIGDEIKDAWNRPYRIESVKFWNIGDSFSYRICGASEKILDAMRPTTSGTWHLDGDSIRTDPRNRMKTWLESHLTVANLKKDDGTPLVASERIIQFDNPDYTIYPIFITKAVYLLFSVGKTSAKPKHEYLHVPYAFEESVPINLYAIDKTGITATNLIEQAEQEIRHVATDHPYGSIRSIDTVKHAPIDLGECLMWNTTVTINYTRANDDYAPTAPAFSEGIAFTYEGDRLAGGLDGTWDTAGHLGGSTVATTTNSENNLQVYCSAYVGDAYVHSETDTLATTVYTTYFPRCRFRYKTGLIGNAKLKLELYYTDATSDVILAETTSATWKTVDVPLTANKYLREIRVHLTTNTGTVYLDFIQFYRSNFILPNVVKMDPPFMVKDAELEIPGMSGDLTQSKGSGLMEVTMTCDLDMQPWSGDVADTSLSWKRPQTNGTKTDYNNTDILDETEHLGGIDVLWVWLNLGNPKKQFKARLKSVHPSFSGEAGQVDLVWKEYRHGSAEGETASERFGLSL